MTVPAPRGTWPRARGRAETINPVAGPRPPGRPHPDGNADNYEIEGPALASLIADVSVTEYDTTTLNNDQNRTVLPADADFFECSEGDGGDDDADGGTTICDAEWVNDVTVTFADGTFGCKTTRDVTITCEWDADGGRAQGRNALPDVFRANDIEGGADSNLSNFLKCTAS